MRPWVWAITGALLFSATFTAPMDGQPPKKQLPAVQAAPKAAEPVEEKGRGYVPLTPAQRRVLHDQNVRRHGLPIRRMAENTVNPPAFDCKDRGWVVPVWDQGQCGSCYLVSTVRTMTCTFVKNGYGKNDGSFALAAQFGMDCQNFGGCNGGNGTEVIEWARKNGWYAEKYVDATGKVISDYPSYIARQGNCRVPPGAKKWMIADWGFIDTDGSFDIESMKTALNNFGPLNIAIDAGGQFGNGTSTITSLGNGIDHEIMVTAYDDNHDNGNGTKGAVLLSNQWGTNWANGGYRWCSYGACRQIVDWFWVSATPLIPPTPPPTPPPPLAAFNLFEGAKQVGTLTGYLTLAGAEVDGRTIATKDNSPVSVVSAGAVVEVIQPGTPPPTPPIPPLPPGGTGTFTLTFPGPVTVRSSDGTMTVVMPGQTISGTMVVTSGMGVNPEAVGRGLSVGVVTAQQALVGGVDIALTLKEIVNAVTRK